MPTSLVKQPLRGDEDAHPSHPISPNLVIDVLIICDGMVFTASLQSFPHPVQKAFLGGVARFISSLLTSSARQSADSMPSDNR